MNKYFFISKNKRKSKALPNQGFALIATITLMVLLALLSIGLLTIAASQTRISEKGIFAAEAKAQARLAMGVAIGRLQCELGPDQRISANSGILDTSPESEAIDGVPCPHILGVWNSWDTWANRKNSNGQSLADTYSKGREEMFRTWLISSSSLEEITKLNTGARTLGSQRGAKDERKIRLLGEGTLGRTNDKNREIYAGLVQVDDASNPLGIINKRKSSHLKSIAWWISGENQKVRVNLPKFKSSKQDDISILRHTWDTPAPEMTGINQFRDVAKSLPSSSSPDYDQKVMRLITWGTIDITAGGNKGTSTPNELFHDISFTSSSLESDVKFGGLKRDMNIMMSTETIPEEFTKTNADVGLRPYDNQDGEPKVTNRPIGSWNQLRYWSNLWDDTQLTGQDISASLKWDGKKPYTLIAADADAQSTVMNNRYTYMRTPVLLRQYNFIGYAYACVDFMASLGGFLMPYTMITPVCVWWNPYNVDMRMKGANEEEFGTYTSTERQLPLKTAFNFEGNYGSSGEDKLLNDGLLKNFTDERYSMFSTKSAAFGMAAAQNRPLADYGSALRKTVKMSNAGVPDDGEASTLKSGEIIIYSMPDSERGLPLPKNAGDASWAERMPHPMTAKRDKLDIKVNSYPLKEGWSENPNQVLAYAWPLTHNGTPFAMLDGSGFAEPQPKRKAKVDFALSSSELEFIPKSDFILSTKYSRSEDKTNDLGTFTNVSGLFDPKLIGKPFEIGKQGNHKDPDSFVKKNPAFLNINWGVWEDPFIKEIKFPAELYRDINNTARPYSSKPDAECGGYGKWCGQNGTGSETPEFVAYYGVSAKWSQSPIIGTYPEKGDFRAKTWQHSSPIFWGGQMGKGASDLSRSYSPYQFEVKHFNDRSGFATISIANVLNNTGTRRATFGGPGAESVNKISALELPIHPPYSIAGFAGARLTPGWYETDSDTAIDMGIRFAYQSGVPGVGLGNSFADPMIPATTIFSSNELMGVTELADFWDHALMANDGVWDTWFASSLSSRPNSIGSSNKQTLKEVVNQMIQTQKKSQTAVKDEQPVASLANSNYIFTPGIESPQDIADALLQTDGYKKASRYIRSLGAFNVNSTSATAWKTIIESLKDRQILYNDPSVGITALPQDKGTTYFSRFAIPMSKSSHVDDYGATGVTSGIPAQDEAMEWSDLRKIDDKTMDKLAKELVKQTKQRGPFLNLSEYINRRLSDDDMGLKGALQQAIDDSGINDVFNKELKEAIITPKAPYNHAKAAIGSVYTAAPGYLIQSDVLAALGNILTVRDDSFTIRAYGEISDKSGKNILSRAWCEASVKRGIEYVSPVDPPELPAQEADIQSGQLKDTALSRINKAFGRRFQIVSFKWLSPEEV
ncbi:MAG: hypothetical protein RR250_01715 [Akkermansia sp.]